MAGEMQSQDLEPGGEFYETRLAMEEFAKEAGFGCVVKPFDRYQGPYGQLINPITGDQMGSIWMSSNSPDSYIYDFDHRQDKVELDSPDLLKKHANAVFEFYNADIEFLKANGTKLKSFTLKIYGETFKQVKMGDTLPLCDHLELFHANAEDKDRPFIEIIYRPLNLVKRIDLKK